LFGKSHPGKSIKRGAAPQNAQEEIILRGFGNLYRFLLSFSATRLDE
jgi:hypothetical protein